MRVTLDYKTVKSEDNIDWESCQSKYSDIYNEYLEQYPAHSAINGKDFPHESVITKAQVVSKLKGIRGKYRQAVGSGRRNGHGRVILIFYEICQQIWGRAPPGTSALGVGLETAELQVGVSESTATTSRSSTPLSELDNGSTDVPAWERRDTLQTKLSGHRKDRFKRRAPSDSATLEDLRLKRRMVDILEESERRNNARLDQIAQNISAITETIKEGFSLLGTMMQQQPQRPQNEGEPTETFKIEPVF